MRSRSSWTLPKDCRLALGCALAAGSLLSGCDGSGMTARRDAAAPAVDASGGLPDGTVPSLDVPPRTDEAAPPLDSSQLQPDLPATDDLAPPQDLFPPPLDLSPPLDQAPPPQERPALDSNTDAKESNLALGKEASQSSTYAAGAVAASAVDGNTDGNFYDGSVTNTNLDAYAWWQVDLQEAVAIDTIVVWNRTDSASSRLSDYWVFVSTTPFEPLETPTTLKNRVATWNNHQTVTPNPSTAIPVGGAVGRYVRVQLNKTEYLTLAEVEVKLGNGTNVALGKPASQSSTIAKGAVAASAVDGSTDGNFANGSVTNTNSDPYAWWQVDLGFVATISSIVIWNRTDCCTARLSDYWVFVSESPFAATDTPATTQGRAGVWSSHQTTVPSPSVSIATGSVRGRYVRVQLSGTEYLHVAEVQVMGSELPPP